MSVLILASFFLIVLHFLAFVLSFTSSRISRLASQSFAFSHHLDAGRLSHSFRRIFDFAIRIFKSMAPVAPNLKITPTPFKPSRLGIPSSPFSPRSPITPSPRAPPKARSSVTRPPANKHANPPPGVPLLWLWRCHMCNHNYPLGATRRCLEDGHHFCSGTTVTKTRRTNGKTKFKRHQSCTSEFDYRGWKRWAEWRREQTGYATTQDNRSPHSPKPDKDCWNRCDYPSECRWGPESAPTPPKVEPVVSPVVSPVALTDITSTPPPTTFDSILHLGGLIKQAQQSSGGASPKSPTRETLGAPFWQSILNATRSRRAADPNKDDSSPLRLDSVQEEGEDEVDEKSPSTTLDSSPTEEEAQGFEDAMDIDDVGQSSTGELQMPSVPLRRFSKFEENVDSDDEDMDEEIETIARYEDADMELDPRLGSFDFNFAK